MYLEIDPIVTLPNGQIIGHVLTSPDNTLYYAFQEIPYASPPVGNLRFKVNFLIIITLDI
ncbi:hypothetical protein NQ314_020291 [Rhamnusium bicolor]|uniref:Carboxylesterase type B domain-containing protein n=1 Tax=Rhamnusium bicolor TaxID=1586634 RepID=A0AAV8WLS1_9CUCU|nr:hypothetical protein NQ314_020291 [Rhamnusium bicolor]